MERIEILGRYKNGDDLHYSLFKCPECEDEVIRQTSNGMRQHSCGCVPINFVHGKTDPTLYYKWVNMKTRCNNSNSTQYKYYGGKGVGVCKEWNDSYVSFMEWALGNGYAEDVELALSRKDHDSDYSPNNCEFISVSANCKDAAERRWGALKDKAIESWKVYVS